MTMDIKEDFTENEEDFEVYHQGFAEQVSKWPKNPNDLILKSLKQKEAYKNILDYEYRI